MCAEGPTCSSRVSDVRAESLHAHSPTPTLTLTHTPTQSSSAAQHGECSLPRSAVVMPPTPAHRVQYLFNGHCSQGRMPTKKRVHLHHRIMLGCCSSLLCTVWFIHDVHTGRCCSFVVSRSSLVVYRRSRLQQECQNATLIK